VLCAPVAKILRHNARAPNPPPPSIFVSDRTEHPGSSELFTRVTDFLLFCFFAFLLFCFFDGRKPCKISIFEPIFDFGGHRLPKIAFFHFLTSFFLVFCFLTVTGIVKVRF
jgi:hypothetical protein